jgi:hypothetical protein
MLASAVAMMKVPSPTTVTASPAMNAGLDGPGVRLQNPPVCTDLMVLIAFLGERASPRTRPASPPVAALI